LSGKKRKLTSNTESIAHMTISITIRDVDAMKHQALQSWKSTTNMSKWQITETIFLCKKIINYR
jgi:hypothetical protein